ncbi:molybdopterin-dependent oxidoreductase [Paraflavitalea speifideaquila]|uniref:molybdopterin-dependent oxidoreductase n=1 Tax=Paraflavitalea speifideaquila TaxID=3076558 RepID=UPI0028E29438|nr:molybdopterin-dependent oxidoreductase [Paraflavitalea speifideiaquila]
MKTARLYLLLLVTTLSFHYLQAQEKAVPDFIKISGEVKKPLQLTVADLVKMKQTTATLKDRDGNNHTYSGVAVQDILTLAGAATGKQLQRENMAQYLLVRCADGYEVTFSLAELDSSFTDRVVILAHELEGKPLPAGKVPFAWWCPAKKSLPAVVSRSQKW